jgi:hypothetical protein
LLQNAKQKKVTISIDEWKIAQKQAKRQGFTTPTAWIRHLIRVNAKTEPEIIVSPTQTKEA